MKIAFQAVLPRFGIAQQPLPPIDLSQPGSVKLHQAIQQAPGKIIVLAGPSGVGKGTAKAGLFADPAFQDVVLIKSYKTRQLRPGEEGADSDCKRVSEDDFQRMAQQGELFQYTNFKGNWYGTVLQDVVSAVKNHSVAFLELTAEFALQIKKVYGDKVTTIFIAPPNKTDLLTRLRERGTEDELTIQRRYQAADAELALQPYFDEVIVSENGKKQDSIDQLKALIRRIKTC
jgi:guanylate kinase